MEEAIVLDGVSRSFGEKTVLRNVSLQVGRGEIFGLLGPSGAGKTTLIRILTGQLKADAGSALIGGKDPMKLKGADYKKIGIMADHFGVYERLSCFDNLKIFARIYRIGNDAVYKALSDVGLSDAKKTAAGNLSKGMKNRLRLARAFMTDPAVLFLDEPTSGLDPAAAEEIQRLIRCEKEKGKTIFLTTHNMAEAQKLCGRIALLCDGHILESGAPQEICRRYDHQKRIRFRLMDGTEQETAYSPDAGERIGRLLSEGKIETIHSSEPDLETVFMELTGRELSR